MISLLLGCSPTVPTAADPSTLVPGTRALHVLFVGNSYTQRNDLPGTWATMTPGNMSTTVAAGGYTLDRHAADAADENSALAAALAKPWDAIVLQEQSQTPGLSGSLREASEAAVHQLATEQTVMFQTWGRRDGDPMNPSIYPDFETMQDALTAGVDAYGLPVVPVGEAFRAVRVEDPALFERLYAADGSHPSPLGTWLAALVFREGLDGLPASSVPAPDGVDVEVHEVLVRAAESVTPADL